MIKPPKIHILSLFTSIQQANKPTKKSKNCLYCTFIHWPFLCINITGMYTHIHFLYFISKPKTIRKKYYNFKTSGKKDQNMKKKGVILGSR